MASFCSVRASEHLPVRSEAGEGESASSLDPLALQTAAAFEAHRDLWSVLEIWPAEANSSKPAPSGAD